MSDTPVVSPCGTHHLRGGAAMYTARFDSVLPFHAPGLAPVFADGKAWHINTGGVAAYRRVFLETFGFYENLAAVRDGDGWFHIHPDGKPAYRKRRSWCGNFQGGRCVVCDGGKYYHILPDGKPLYAGAYNYVGDFREGRAAVRHADGLCAHIDEDGKPAHRHRYLDLDAYHKGYARARDDGGWMHINKDGEPLYSGRYAALEPFYNGRAVAHTFDGAVLIINAAGEKVATLGQSPGKRRDLFHELSADMTGYWKTFAIAAAVELNLLQQLPLADKKIPPDGKIKTLLSALAALGIVGHAGDVWRLSEKGALLLPDNPHSLADAAAVWGEFAAGGTQSWSDAAAGKNTDDFFAAISQKPEMVEKTHRMLSVYAKHDYADIADTLPLDGVKHLVDAGGGTGIAAGMLARKHRQLAITVIDRPEVLRLFAAKSKRITPMAGDIFSDWRVRADAVLLARVLHDWDDGKALLILQNANRALTAGGSLFIVESAPETDEECALLSMHLLAVSGGMERSKHRHRALLARAGFSPENFIRINPAMAVITARKTK